MPLHDLPPVLWLVALLATLVTVGLALRDSVRSPDSSAAPPPMAWATAGGLLLVSAVAAYFLAPEPLKGAWIAGSMALGGLLSVATGLGPAWLLGRGDPRRVFLGRVGLALIAMIALDRFISEPVLGSHALMGLLLGWSVGVAPEILGGRLRSADMAAALGGVGAVALATVWGDRALPAESLGSAWSLLVAAVLVLSAMAATWAPRAWAPLVALALGLGLLLPAAWWGAAITPMAWQPLFFGLGLAAAAGSYLYWAERAGLAGPVAGLAPVVVAGAMLVLANRLFGMWGVSLMALGLMPMLLVGGRAVSFAGVLMGAFGARAALQVFLDRTYLHSYGVDLTHPYALVGLLLGLLLPLALLGLRRTYTQGPVLTGLLALSVTGLPVLLGYLLHAEPLGTYLVGLLAMAFVLTSRLERDAPVSDAGSVVTAPLLAAVAWALIAAPWLLQNLNAPRSNRIATFAVALVLVGGYLWALLRPKGQPLEA